MRSNVQMSAGLLLGLVLVGCSGDKPAESEQERSGKPVPEKSVQTRSDQANVVLKVPEMT
jgi:hypothetical protein